MSELTWKLGLGEETRAVIITADDLGKPAPKPSGRRLDHVVGYDDACLARQ